MKRDTTRWKIVFCFPRLHLDPCTQQQQQQQQSKTVTNSSLRNNKRLHRFRVVNGDFSLRYETNSFICLFALVLVYMLSPLSSPGIEYTLKTEGNLSNTKKQESAFTRSGAFLLCCCCCCCCFHSLSLSSIQSNETKT